MDLTACTFLPALGDGRKHAALRIGLPTCPSGQDHVHANLSAPPAAAAARPTRAICGLKCADSSPSAALQLSLENKLQARTVGLGSPLYALTWKRWGMPSGLPIYALRASAPRTRGSASIGLRIGWPTALARDSRTPGARKPTVGQSLSVVARLAGWCTPTAMDSARGERPPHPQDKGIPLTQQVAQCGPLRITPDGVRLTGSIAETITSGPLNPAHSRWLMGYRAIWDDCAPYSRDWALVQGLLTSCCGNPRRTLRELARIALSACAGTETPSSRRLPPPS